MKKSIVITLICIFTLTGIAIARGPGIGMGGQQCKMEGAGCAGRQLPPGKWWQLPDIAKKLNLTSDEKTTLETLYTQKREKMIDHKANFQREMLNLEQILESEKFNSSAAKDQFNKVQNARITLAAERFNYLVEVRNLLGLQRSQQLKAGVINPPWRGKCQRTF